ncbi:MAG: metallophosphoesterase, partial [Ignavibacteria bacterium]|nr:metallophosphoesterase [Ignavibacteria bacterium]
AQTKFAIIGDYGNNSSNELAVANMVKSWNPAFIITTGDNNYPNGRASTIDDNVGKYYQQFIGNYTGGFGSGATSNEFFPSLGNHDWNTTNAQPYIDYFTLPGNDFINTSGNERYYDFVWDNIHFFAIDSDTDEPDGVTSSSTQGQWLETQLTNCVANHSHWRIAYDHHPGYCSEKDESYMRWPFESWGAHTVISGHAHTYERLSLDKTNSTAMRFFVNGLGGKSVRPLENPISQSEFQYGGDFGAQLVTVNSTEMILEFYSISDGLVDSWTIQESIPDITPPSLLAAEINSPTQVMLFFSESLDSQSAQDENNYSIDNGINVISAVLNSNNRDVTLTTSEHTITQQYTVTVNNVTDLAGNTIDPSANSAQYFFEVDITPPELISAFATVSTEVNLFFSESLDPQSAQEVANYNINNGISVISAVLSSNNRDVTLTTSEHITNQLYTVTVNDVLDLSGNIISPDNNSADYELIIIPGPGFPVDLFGTPESEKSAFILVTIPANAPEFATYYITAFDADHGGEDPPEGNAFINGNGPVELFPGATQENGDGQTNEFEFITPTSWWIDGVNELKFVRLYSTGYRIDTAYVAFNVTEIEEENNVPSEFVLEQNYPNPFNPTTTINFSISDLRFTILKVYDILGNEVATLVNEELPAGEYEVGFNSASGIRYPASGIYFYQLRAGSFVQTKKMILLK